MTGALNGIAFASALVLGGLLAGYVAPEPEAAPEPGARSIEDAGGHAVPVRRYERIASASTIADQVLAEIAEPSRVATIAAHTRRIARAPWRYEGKAELQRLDDREAILALDPDLVVASGFADPGQVARLRRAGLEVFDLGAMHGLESLLDDIRTLGALIDEPERGEQLASRFERRFRRVAAHLAPEDRARAVYVGAFGDRLYGGSRGTSYGDVLRAAGVIDVAAEHGFEGWPAYRAEELLAMDPPWIVTADERAETLCRYPGLANLRACEEGRLVGVPENIVTDPGLGMLDAAEIIHARLYGDTLTR